LVRNIGTLRPQAMCRTSIPAAMSDSSNEKEQPIAKLTRSSRQTWLISPGSSTNSPFRHTR
jgi:hypothetical protein